MMRDRLKWSSKEREVLLYRPIPQGCRPLDEVLSVRRMTVISSFRSSFLTSECAGNVVWEGTGGLSDQFAKKSLASRAFIVQNVPAWS